MEMIAAVIPAYKNQNQLQKCIEHLKNQTVEVDIFVRDNTNSNINFTAAVNEGIIKYLSGPHKYILILNQDMYLQPDAVEKMTTFMDAHPECGISAPLQLAGQTPDFVTFAGGYEAFPAGKHRHGPLSKFTRDEEISWCNGACMMLRKEMIQRIGLLDENFVFIGSDSDYCFTARSRGWQVWLVADAKGVHERGTSSFISDLETEILKIEDMIYFGKKWLTGQLYRELTKEADTYTLESIKKTMEELLQTEKELKTIHMEQQGNLVSAG
jgi:GT2 family glycosyltransferase